MQMIEGRGYDRIRILSFLKKQSLCILLYSILAQWQFVKAFCNLDASDARGLTSTGDCAFW